MAIKTGLHQRQKNAIIESSTTAGQEAHAVCNPDGSDVGSSITVTADTEFPAAAALADDTANPTTTLVGSLIHGFDGSTWDRVNVGTDDSAMPATPTFLPSGGEYRAAPTTYSDGDATVDQHNVRGAKKTDLDTALDSTNDSITAHVGADSTVVGMSTLFDSDGDNTAQALSSVAGNLYSMDIVNGGSTLNTSESYVQWFDVATGSVTVGTTTPKYVMFIPASGAYVKELNTPMTFSTAITYACTTTPTGSGDPTNGLTCSFGFK